MQFASFYMPGKFTPHVRMMKAGFENVELAKKFGMPYVLLRKTRPYDTTTLNYNWQIWETHAFSIYTTTTAEVDGMVFFAHDDPLTYANTAVYKLVASAPFPG